MIRRSYLIFLVAAAVAFIFTLSPASGAWGARWSSGSAIGSGTVSGLLSVKHTGANVSSVLSHPGAQFCTKKSKYNSSHHDRDDCRDHDADKDSYGTFGVMSPPPPGSTPGLVFCQDQNNPSNVQRGKIVNVTANLNGTAVIPASSIDNHGNATFSIHDQVDLNTLRSQIPTSIACPTTTSSGHSSGYGMKDSHHTPPPPNWQLIDFVPQQFSVSLQATDSHGRILTQAIFDCHIDTAALNSLQYHQQKPYTCTTRFNQ